MKCFYHNDLDGKAAAYLISSLFKKPEDFIEINYDIPFPFEEIEPNETVYIVDYSIEPKEMDRLRGITENVVWVDHHKTAIEKYKDYPHEIDGIRYDGIAGCVLTWLYLMNVKPEMWESEAEDAPYQIRLIGDRDIWAWKYGNETLWFCSGAELYDLHPLSNDWNTIIENHERIMQEGKTVERYKVQRNKEYLKEFGYVTEFEGMKAWVVNIGQVDSKIFDSVDPDYKTPLYIMYADAGDFYKVSLRSPEDSTVDVSQIAQKYGGGGHFHAAGFNCEVLPWKPENCLKN